MNTDPVWKIMSDLHMLHVEAAVEVLTSAFGSPCIEGLLGSQLRMSRLEFRECFGIASGY